MANSNENNAMQITAPNTLQSIIPAPQPGPQRVPQAEASFDEAPQPPALSLIDAWPGSSFPRVLPPTLSAHQQPARTSHTFYQRQEAPWRDASSVVAQDQRWFGSADETSRASYLNKVIERSNQAVHRAYEVSYEFRQQLPFLNPELANKHFGFTLGPDQRIQVTDPDGVLTPAEMSYLSEKLNALESLQQAVREHARTVLELVDHLTEKFAGGYQIDLSNYHRIIDYGQIFTRNTIGNFMDTWAWQVMRHAEPREDPQEPRGTQIDLQA